MTPTFSSTWSTYGVLPPLFASYSDFDPHFSLPSAASATYTVKINHHVCQICRLGQRSFRCKVITRTQDADTHGRPTTLLAPQFQAPVEGSYNGRPYCIFCGAGMQCFICDCRMCLAGLAELNIVRSYMHNALRPSLRVCVCR